MKPIDLIFYRFKGATALAAALGLPITTVHSWKRRGVIPAGRMADVLDAAVAAGVPVTAEDLVRCACDRTAAA